MSLFITQVELFQLLSASIFYSLALILPAFKVLLDVRAQVSATEAAVWIVSRSATRRSHFFRSFLSVLSSLSEKEFFRGGSMSR